MSNDKIAATITQIRGVKQPMAQLVESFGPRGVRLDPGRGDLVMTWHLLTPVTTHGLTGILWLVHVTIAYD